MQKQPTPRQLAWEALGKVLGEGRNLDEALPPETDSHTRALLLVTLRHLGQIDALLKPLLDKPVPAKHRPVMDVLRLGVAQLVVLDTAPHAAVNESVELVKGGKHAALSGMVNAVLKKVKGPLPDARNNLPGWIEKRWKAQYGKAVTDAICFVAAERPPLDLNTAQSFDEGIRLDEHIWRMPANHTPVPELPGYDEGAFFVQDVAASYPVRLLGNVNGKRVLDIGAAPGGKTAQLARDGAIVTALDKSAPRSKRLQANMERLKLDVDVVIADALEYEPATPFDIVVLDAPCSATGTWRRHPEVVHITAAEDIAELAATQRALLARAWEWVRPGGTLVYCVCSLECEEGEDQQEWFMTQYPEAVSRETRRTTPAELSEQGGMDGFFAVTFEKR